jgi:hypothetical protein
VCVGPGEHGIRTGSLEHGADKRLTTELTLFVQALASMGYDLGASSMALIYKRLTTELTLCVQALASMGYELGVSSMALI